VSLYNTFVSAPPNFFFFFCLPCIVLLFSIFCLFSFSFLFVAALLVTSALLSGIPDMRFLAPARIAAMILPGSLRRSCTFISFPTSLLFESILPLFFYSLYTSGSDLCKAEGRASTPPGSDDLRRAVFPLDDFHSSDCVCVRLQALVYRDPSIWCDDDVRAGCSLFRRHSYFFYPFGFVYPARSPIRPSADEAMFDWISFFLYLCYTCVSLEAPFHTACLGLFTRSFFLFV